jgi:hypothetical protein
VSLCPCVHMCVRCVSGVCPLRVKVSPESVTVVLCVKQLLLLGLWCLPTGEVACQQYGPGVAIG